MVRRMRDVRYREQQWRDRFAPHVAPINELVDELGTRDEAGHPPYVAPMYKGVRARALAILRDPGPKAGGENGSGFLSVENDDQSAQRQDEFFRGAGIDPAEVVPWNAYPWYINSKPTREQLLQGTEPLRRLIALLPHLRVVILEGIDAKAAWDLFVARHGAWVRSRGIEAVSTYHPSRQALQHPDPAERDRREEHIRSTLRRAARVIDEHDSGPGVEKSSPSAPEGLRVIDVDVIGRPAAASTPSELPWRAAVTAAIGRRDVPDGVRFAIEVEYRLPSSRKRNDRWDLDGLLTPTFEALGGAIGWRRGQGRPQADDERIDRIVASKRPATGDEEPGARLRIVPLASPRHES